MGLTKFRTKILEIDINEQDNFQVEKAKLEQELENYLKQYDFEKHSFVGYYNPNNNRQGNGYYLKLFIWLNSDLGSIFWTFFSKLFSPDPNQLQYYQTLQICYPTIYQQGSWNNTVLDEIITKKVKEHFGEDNILNIHITLHYGVYIYIK